MQIRNINSREAINTLRGKDKIVHISFRPNNKDILNIIYTNPNIEAIEIPISYSKTMSQAITMALDTHNVRLLRGDVWGKNKKFHEYLSVPDDVFESAYKFKKDGYDREEIKELIKKETGYDDDFVDFLVEEKI